MTQANFMRNLRMTLPQYITNLSSFEDSVRILKNKGILTEADEKTNESWMDRWLKDVKDIIEDKWQNGEISQAKYGSLMNKLSTQSEDIIAKYGEDSAEAAAEELLYSVSHLSNDLGPGEDEDFERDYDMDYEEPNEPFDMAESLNEAKDGSTEGKWKTVTGKDLYGQFKEIDNLNGQEVLIGINYEMIKNPELTKLEAQKIVIKNLKKNPIYYTAEDMSGVEGYEPEYIGGKSANPEAHQMQYLEKNMGNVVDKKRGMQPVKNVEKVKKDSDKGGETNKMEKGVSLMSLIAKSTRGVQKMDATGEKMKKVSVKENKVASTIFDKNANITKGVNKIAKEDDKKKSIKDKLKEMIRKELREMADGMEPMVRTRLDENELSSQEQTVVDDILNSLDEGIFGDVLDKVKSYAKKGLMTAAILGALLSAPNFTQAQQQQIKQVAQTEMSSTQNKKGGGIEKMSDQEAYNYVYNMAEKNPDGLIKQLQNYKPSTQEDKADVNMLLTFVRSVKNGSPIKDTKYMGKRFKMAAKVIITLDPVRSIAYIN